MPSFASGLIDCTACAMTCAAEWRRMLSPSGESMRHRLDGVGRRRRGCEVFQFAVDAHGDDVAVGEQLESGLLGTHSPNFSVE